MRGAAVVLVALAVAGCGGGKAAAQREPAPRRAPPRGGGPTRAASSRARGELSLRVLRAHAAVIVHVPDGLRAGQRAPLVLGLHGAGQDARGFEAESNLSNVADEHHFVVAYPMSWRARGFWHYPEPDNPRSALRLLRATLDAVGAPACVDAGRVLVTGISSGGRMTYAAGCELADRILAIAPGVGRHARPAALPSGAADLGPRHPRDLGPDRLLPRPRRRPRRARARRPGRLGASARAAVPSRASAASTPT